MRISVLACILSGVAAICIYACVVHVVAARNEWYRTVHLIFAALASMAAVHAIAHSTFYFTLERREHASVPATAQIPPAAMTGGAERTHTG